MDNAQGELSPPPPPPKHVPPPLSFSPTDNAPPTHPSPSSPARKSNPLTDLLDSEKSYVDHLTGIIRKVAAAWSRSNLPPPQLDTMFRTVEGVYKASRTFYARLKEIATSPSNPKALGDLLMRWIDDLQGPYSNYCSKYRCGFDVWEPIRSNAKLANILTTFSASNPPPSSAIASNTINPPTWTLDDLFLLPKARLKYYKKLYGRLLKSTAPGKSDHKLLIGALESLDQLLATLESRSSIRVGELDTELPTPLPLLDGESVEEVVIDLRTQSVIEHQNRQNSDVRLSADTHPGSESSSTRDSSVSGGERYSRETPTTTVSRASSTTLSMPLSDLERRLSTQRTLDIFTMKPKIVRLQMAPPSLTFTRELRLSMDVIIRFTSQATGIEVVHSFGHIYLLSDLFLIAERMTPQERSLHGQDGADSWLSYPPLAGKVLRVFEIPEKPKSLRLVIMRKETLFLETQSTELRNALLTQFRECIEFSQSLPPASKVPPPPVPPLNDLLRGPTNPSFPSHPSSNPREPSIINSFPPSTFQRNPPPGQPVSHGPSPGTSFGGPGPVRPNFVPAPGRGPSPSRLQNPPGSYGPSPFQPGSNQPNPPNRAGSNGLPPGALPPNPYPPPRPPSEPGLPNGPPLGIRKSPSGRSLASQYSHYEQNPGAAPPPIPAFPGGHPSSLNNFSRNSSYSSLPRLLPPSLQSASRSVSMVEFDEPSPPNSPVQETSQHVGPVTSTISAQMKCKVFLQQQHAQWKSLGSAKLKLYRQDPTNIKQLVVEADNKEKSIMISTIVLTDGVERVGKTGVAIELSDKGQRTGIIYMIQLRNEKSAGGLFDSLLQGSDRATRN
ncbi:Breakpoint cluster region protein [Termitomyces sp. J132]|nr:Breakpoint cluster region protein [Termitomyces sp. J132]